ncbi:MAG: efflux RND transporter permease subunit [Gammaproteobacteria bacterium]|nr:efflux RND transporter permease subunit [Gammaproteobacteria bacterium]
MRLIDIATKRRVTIMMFTVAVIMFGLVSLSRLKVNLLPDLSYPTMTVRTELTGAAPIEIESLITKPVEEAVGVIRNVRQVRSVSRTGQSDVVLEFAWGTDMDIAGVDVREKLDILQLPLEASRSMLLRFDPSGEPIMRLALIEDPDAEIKYSSDEDRLKSLRRFADEQLKTALEASDGTAAVKASGGLEDEIQILVDQVRLAQLGLSIEIVTRRIREENVNLSGGRLEQGSQRFLVRTINEFQDISEIANSIVANVDGRVIYLRDVAEIRRGFKEREAITRVNGQESVELGIYKEGDANTVHVASRIKQRLENMDEDLPGNMKLITIYDQSTFISDAISQVRSAALWGGLLAILVLYFFLRDARATFIIGAAIPVSVVGTFLMMYSSEISLNIMSLGGIALAIGMLVDNSIVVLENIVRKKEAGLPLLQASREGSSEVATAVIASTLTTIAVFFPMVFVSGIAGQLFKDQALTVTFALIFSLIVALTLIPMLAALGAGDRFADATDDRPPARITRGIGFVVRMLRRFFSLIAWSMSKLLRPGVWLFQGFYQGLARVYPGVLAWSLKHRWLVILIAFGIFTGTMSLVPRLGSELIPQLAQGEFFVDVRLPPGTPLSQTDQSFRSVEQVLSEDDSVELTYSVAGTGNRLDASPVDSGEHTGKISVQMKPGSTRILEDQVMDSMRQKLQALPGVQYEFGRPTLFSFSTPLEVEVSGFDLNQITAVSNRIQQAMAESSRFADIKTTVESGNPEIQIVFDQERAANLGLVVRDIANRVVSNVRGDVATRYTWRDRKIDVLVRSIDTDEASVAAIRRLIVNPASDRPIPLEAIADIRMATGPAEVRRVDQSRVAIISANLAFGDLGTAAAELQQIINSTPLPAGIGAQITGQNEEMQASMRSMQFTLMLAVFLVYLVMASQFESLIHPFVILFTIPLALVGAVLALFVTGTPINVVAFIGVIMLAGIVVNNAIVLVDMINKLRETGTEKTAAIIEAGKARLRPILMTTLTTTLGLLPMAIGFGEGSEVRTPMAITVIGGLLTSTLLTLIVIPAVYSLMDRRPVPISAAETSLV